MAKPVLVKIGDSKLDRNFDAVAKAFAGLDPVISDTIALQTGDNRIKPPAEIKKPKGRITVYQDAVADLTDKGLNSDGFWVLTASAACNVKLWFV